MTKFYPVGEMSTGLVIVEDEDEAIKAPIKTITVAARPASGSLLRPAAAFKLAFSFLGKLFSPASQIKESQ